MRTCDNAGAHFLYGLGAAWGNAKCNPIVPPRSSMKNQLSATPIHRSTTVIYPSDIPAFGHRGRFAVNAR